MADQIGSNVRLKSGGEFDRPNGRRERLIEEDLPGRQERRGEAGREL